MLVIPRAPTKEGRFGYVLAYMTHPTDEVRRAELLAWLRARDCLVNGVPFNADGRELAALVRASFSGDVKNDLLKAAHGGHFAGKVLLYVLQMQATPGVQDAGLDKAKYLTTRFFAHFNNKKGEPFRATRETVDRHWKEFRSVAHLYAAERFWMDAVLCEPNLVEFDGLRERILDRFDDCLDWFGLAESLRTLGIKCTLPRSDKKLLDLDTTWQTSWATPVAAPVVVPPLATFDLKWLSEYTRRSRSD